MADLLICLLRIRHFEHNSLFREPLRLVCGKYLADEHGKSSSFNGLCHKILAVEALALERDEERALRNLSRIGDNILNTLCTLCAKDLSRCCTYDVPYTKRCHAFASRICAAASRATSRSSK